MNLKHLITDVTCDCRQGDRVGIGCTLEGFQYHFWLYPETMDVGETLYKNPPKGTPYKGPGYFHTRRLNPTKTFGKALIAAMLEVYQERNLLGVLEAQEKDEQEKRDAEGREIRRLSLLREAAPELYEALRDCMAQILAFDPGGCSAHLPGGGRLGKARAALEKAEKGTPESGQ